MNKLKTALIESYAGAILVALFASTGVSNFVQPIFSFIGANVAAAKSGRPSTFGPELAIFPFAHALVYLLLAFLVLRWLYFPTKTPPAEEVDPAPEA
jgi:hypothetical protein